MERAWEKDGRDDVANGRTGGGGAFAFAFVFAGLILSFVRLHLLFLSMHRFNGGENRISQ